MLLATIVALPIARLVAAYPGRWSVTVERLLYGIYAVPSISLALAFVYLTLNAVPALYQSLAALVLAVGLHFLVQPVGAMRGPMLQVSPRFPEAAHSLGQGRLGVLRTITLPLIAPGILAGAGLVFLSTMKELPLTLIAGTHRLPDPRGRRLGRGSRGLLYAGRCPGRDPAHRVLAVGGSPAPRRRRPRTDERPPRTRGAQPACSRRPR